MLAPILTELANTLEKLLLYTDKQQANRTLKLFFVV